MRLTTALLLSAFCLIISCKTVPRYTFIDKKTIPVNYADLKNWAAHPDLEDKADLQPGKEALADQSNLPVDVFFIHPTTYWNDKKYTEWNAPIDLQKLNDKTDETTIKYQASIFNNVGKVYAPRYRQAHVHAYLSTDSISSKKALNFAYKDVEAAFKHYLKNFNQGRPFIIASHSQGTTHAGPLMKKFIDGKPLQQQLIAAYVVGLPVPINYFENIPPCENATQTNCMVSWRTFKENSKPKPHWNVAYETLNTNPLTWKIDGKPAKAELNTGGILRNFNKPLPNLVGAHAHDNLLWTKKPKFPLSFLYRQTNYHIIDYNLFYFNIQQNAQDRVKAFLGNK